MGRLTGRLGLAALALLLAAPAAQAKRCSQYHQRDLAPAKHVRLVERANGAGGTDLLGCILPRGRVRLLAAFVNDIGQSVALVASDGDRALRGFDSHGFGYELDSAGDIAAVKLRGSVVSWTSGGEHHSFALDG